MGGGGRRGEGGELVTLGRRAEGCCCKHPEGEKGGGEGGREETDRIAWERKDLAYAPVPACEKTKRGIGFETDLRVLFNSSAGFVVGAHCPRWRSNKGGSGTRGGGGEGGREKGGRIKRRQSKNGEGRVVMYCYVGRGVETV